MRLSRWRSADFCRSFFSEERRHGSAWLRMVNGSLIFAGLGGGKRQFLPSAAARSCPDTGDGQGLGRRWRIRRRNRAEESSAGESFDGQPAHPDRVLQIRKRGIAEGAYNLSGISLRADATVFGAAQNKANLVDVSTGAGLSAIFTSPRSCRCGRPIARFPWTALRHAIAKVPRAHARHGRRPRRGRLRGGARLRSRTRGHHRLTDGFFSGRSGRR